MKLKTLVSLAVLCLSLPAAAQQTEKRVYIVGDESIGEMSGKAGSKTAMLRVSGDKSKTDQPGNFFVDSVGFAEQSDRPCFVRLDEGTVPTKWADWSSCKGAAGDWEYLKTDNYFSGVQVCLNKAQDRIKGVRLMVSEMVKQENSVLSKLERRKKQTVEMSRPNCDEKDGWASEQKCDEGSMLTGFKIFYRTGEGVGDTSDIISGLAPICRPYTIRVVKTGADK